MEGNILLVEDDVEIREGLAVLLKGQGYEVYQAKDGVEGLERLKEHEVENYDFRVIFLSAKAEEIDKIIGLNMGADDYITKPFTPMALLARVQAQIKRYKRFMDKLESSSLEKAQDNSKIHVVGGLELNEDTVEVRVDGDLVKLTPMEFKILLLLMENVGRVFSAEEIYERVWQEIAINTDTVMVHIRNIREKIEPNPKSPKYLKVVWGVGYKIEKQI